VILWGQAGVTKDVTIGQGAVLLAKSGASKSLEGHKVYFGTPADVSRKKFKEIATLRKLSKNHEA